MLLKRANQHGAAYIQGLSPAAWFRYGQGITVTGAGVSQWDDQSGNGRHLKQATDTNRPSKEADNTILFDGVDNYLKCDAFTLDQPFTHYLLMQQVSFTLNDFVTDGNTGSSAVIYQQTGSPQLVLFAGADANANGDLAVGSYGVVAAVFNGASSLLQINNGTAATGNPGANAAAGFTLGARGTGASAWCHIQVKEVIIFPAAHDATQRSQVIAYLRGVGGI